MEKSHYLFYYATRHEMYKESICSVQVIVSACVALSWLHSAVGTSGENAFNLKRRIRW